MAQDLVVNLVDDDHQSINDSSTQSTFVNNARDTSFLFKKMGSKRKKTTHFSYLSLFGSALSLVNVQTGILPIFSFMIQSGGPVVMIWDWIIFGIFSIFTSIALGELSSLYPSMGATYVWSKVTGGPKWGNFASWIGGWMIILGNVAAMSSSSYASCTVLSEIHYVVTTDEQANSYGSQLGTISMFFLYSLLFIIAAVLNTAGENVLPKVEEYGVIIQMFSLIFTVIYTLTSAKTFATSDFVWTDYINFTGFSDPFYVASLGMLAPAYTFVGYDVAAKLCEESPNATTLAAKTMVGANLACLITGIMQILSMNYAISQEMLPGLENANATESWSHVWSDSKMGTSGAIGLLILLFINLFISLIAAVTSTSRSMYALARDELIPFAHFFYNPALPDEINYEDSFEVEDRGSSVSSSADDDNEDLLNGLQSGQSEAGKKCEMCCCFLWDKFMKMIYQLIGLSITDRNTPFKTVWLCTLIAWVLTTAALPSSAILTTLFSLSSISLFIAYLIPIFFRMIHANPNAPPGEPKFSIGKYSQLNNFLSCIWLVYTVVACCLQASLPVERSNFNFSGPVLLAVLFLVTIWWSLDAKTWFTGPKGILWCEDKERHSSEEIISTRNTSISTATSSHTDI